MGLQPDATEMTARIQDLLAVTFQIPRDQVTPDLAFGDLPEWDSMGHMDVIMRLEELYGIEVSADTISALVSIPAIVEHLKGHPHA
jgi:acyl carrier protein